MQRARALVVQLIEEKCGEPGDGLFSRRRFGLLQGGDLGAAGRSDAQLFGGRDQRFVRERTGKFLRQVCAVSYTHLDVYKRQEYAAREPAGHAGAARRRAAREDGRQHRRAFGSVMRRRSWGGFMKKGCALSVALAPVCGTVCMLSLIHI